MGQGRVPVREKRVCVNRDRSDFEFTAQRTAVQRLDILKLMLVRESFGVDVPGRERVKHERVVRVGAVRYAHDACTTHGPRFFAASIAARSSDACFAYSGSFRADSFDSAAS